MEIYKSFDKKQRIIIVIAILLSVLCIIAGIVYDSSAKEIRITRLARPDSYEDAKNVSFTINVEGIKDDENFKYSGQLAAKKLEENEIDLYLNKALDQIEKTMFRVGENCNRVLTGVNIPAKLPKNPKKPGKTFVGWFLKNDAGEWGEEVTNETIYKWTTDIKVYAKWA